MSIIQPPSLRVLLPASLLWSQHLPLLQTLLDLGNFIDSSLVSQALIPAEKINPPLGWPATLDLTGHYTSFANVSDGPPHKSLYFYLLRLCPQ